MPTPRCEIVNSSQPGVYHCISRCVRRAYLCGDGYEHRRSWMERRIAELTNHMGIDVFAYSILSNHFHVLLAIRPDVVEAWSDDEVADRYLRICPCRWKRRIRGIPVDSDPTAEEVDELVTDQKKLSAVRKRLGCLSWFMAKLKEPIARRANVEDDCTGRFWEGRFKSIAVLDSEALAATAAYVDLNPLRAGMVERPEDAAYTSIQVRIAEERGDERPTTIRLTPIAGMDEKEYLEFVDHWARVCVPGKHAMGRLTSPILKRLGLTGKNWASLIRNGWDHLAGTAIGRPDALRQEANRRGRNWICSPLRPAAT